MKVVLGPWVNDTTGPFPFWRSPTGATGCIDLRSIPEHTTPGLGLFEVPDGFSDSNYDVLTASLTLGMRARLGVTSTNLSDAIWEKMTLRADPNGDTGCPPLCPDHRGLTTLRLGSLIFREKRVLTTDPEWTRQRLLLIRQFVQLVGATLRGKFAWNLMRKLGVQGRDPTQADVEGLLGLSILPVRPETVITETFNTADSSTLGPDLTWSDITGDYTVVSNRARSVDTGGGSGSVSQATTDLSSSDHYAEAEIDTGFGDLDNGPACRVQAGPNCYFMEGVGTNTRRLYKLIGTTFTQLGSTSTAAINDGDVFECEANGSNIRGLVNDVEVVAPVSDSAIASGTRAGLWGWSPRGDLDNFEAGDLAAGTTVGEMLAAMQQSPVIPPQPTAVVAY